VSFVTLISDLIYPGRALTNIRGLDYKEWLSSLEPGANVLLQRFEKPFSLINPTELEFWTLTDSTYRGETVCLAGGDSFAFRAGIRVNEDGSPYLSDIFPQRIVPVDYMYIAKNQTINSNMPIYEPLFYGSTRCKIFLEDAQYLVSQFEDEF